MTKPKSLANTLAPCKKLISPAVHQKEGGSIRVDKLLSLVHDLDDQCVHADHLLEDGPRKRMLYNNLVRDFVSYWTTLRRKLLECLC